MTDGWVNSNGSDLGALAAPSRRGFAQALHEIRRLLEARAGAGRALRRERLAGRGHGGGARAGGRRTAALCGGRRRHGRGAGERPGVFPAHAARQRRRAGAAACARAAGARFVALCGDAAGSAHDACAGWRRCSGCRRGSPRKMRRRVRRGAVPAGGAARAVRGAVPGRSRRSRRLIRDATIAALLRAGFSRVGGGRGRGDVRGARRGDRPLPAGLPPPDPDRAVRRRGRVDPALRRGDAADAAPAGRGLLPSRARDHPDGGRRPAREDPGGGGRRRLSVVEDAAAARADRRGRDVLRHRGAGARVPRGHGAAVRLPARRWRCASSRIRRRSSRRRAARPAACARRRRPAYVEHRLALPAAGLRPAARTRRRRRWRRAGGSSCAAVEVVARSTRARRRAAARPRRIRAAHDAARRPAAGARRRRGGQQVGDIDIGKPLRDRMRSWLDAGHRVRVVAHNRTHADRLVALLRALGLATDVGRAGAGDELFADRSGPPLAVLTGSLRRGFVLPADRLVIVAEEEIFGARAMREARAEQDRRARRSRRDRRGRRGRARRTRHRALPRAQEADRARGAAGLHAPRIRRRLGLRPGLSHRRGPPLRSAARRPRSSSTSWARGPGRRSGAGSRPRRARSPRSCCSSTRSARRCPGTRSRRRTRCSASSRRRSRSRRRPIRQRRSTPCSPTCRTACRWTAWSAATSATARPRSRCAPACSRCWAASRSRCWRRRPCWSSSTS